MRGWGQTGGPCLLPGPSLLALEMLRKCLAEPNSCVICCQVRGGLSLTGLRPPWESATGQGNFWHLPPTPHLSARLALSISALLTPWFYLNTTSLLPPQGLCTYSFF